MYVCIHLSSLNLVYLFDRYYAIVWLHLKEQRLEHISGVYRIFSITIKNIDRYYVLYTHMTTYLHIKRCL